MIVVMQEGATEAQIQQVIDRMVAMGFTVHRSTGVIHTVLGGVGPEEDVDPVDFEVMDGVKEATASPRPTSWPAGTSGPAGTVVKVGDVEIGGDRGGGDGRPVQRGEPRPDRARRRKSWRARALKSSAAAPSSRAARLTASRAWAKRACSCCARPPTATACWWSAR